MPIREYYPNEKPVKMVYVEDPLGIVFEICTHSCELTYSSGAYKNYKFLSHLALVLMLKDGEDGPYFGLTFERRGEGLLLIL